MYLCLFLLYLCTCKKIPGKIGTFLNFLDNGINMNAREKWGYESPRLGVSSKILEQAYNIYVSQEGVRAELSP